RARNTARVDGMDQNRDKNYRWKDGDISTISGMKYRIEDDFDFADAEYNEGYGPDCDRSVTHRRSVVFFKKVPAPLSPFFAVIDRFYAEKNKEHVYDLLWHFDGKTAGLGLRSVFTPVLTLFHSTAERDCTLVMGQEEPEWQGWLADSAIQGDYRPAPTLVHSCRGGSLRVVTLIYPCAKNVCPVIAVEAGGGIDDTDIRIRHGGGELALKEDNYR
ncbi:MAG: heparinase II/III family protein, partial [Treponema sp.]|nr:heparinase II/III family protein [Treponema sp.]